MVPMTKRPVKTTRKPRQQRSIEKYENIIGALSRVIEEGAYLRESTHTIARRAGVSIGTLYEYFESKEAILVALVERDSAVIWQELEREIPRWIGLPPIAALQEIARYVVETAITRRSYVQVAFGNIPGVGSLPPMVQLSKQVEMVVRLVMIRHPQRLTGEQADLLVFLIVGGLTGIVLAVANGLPESVSQAALIERLDQIIAMGAPLLTGVENDYA